MRKNAKVFPVECSKPRKKNSQCSESCSKFKMRLDHPVLAAGRYYVGTSTGLHFRKRGFCGRRMLQHTAGDEFYGVVEIQLRTPWDKQAELYCDYHRKEKNRFCAVAAGRKGCFTIFHALRHCYDLPFGDNAPTTTPTPTPTTATSGNR
ncbi:MAG: hypothetical protein GY820_44625 [Gammaproteobacteria bacterium]|nr:hypothetical protein [Gammaproteobacteria bacterium]